MMKMHKFRAPHMMAALEEVQQKLGANALVVSVREIPPGPVWQVWRRPGVEVVAAFDEKNGKTVPDSLNLNRYQEAIETPKNGNGRPSVPDPPVKTAPLAEPMDTTSKGFPAEEALDPAGESWPTAVSEVYARLSVQGLDGDLLRKIVKTSLTTLPPHKLTNRPYVRDAVRHQLTARLRVPGSETLRNQQVICLVGPSGSGKTSACGKLAAEAIRERGQKVAWICVDTVKTGAIAEAQVYADILELPLFLAHDPQELAQVMQAAADADLILVDTFSCNPWHEAARVELGAFLGVLPAGSIFLTAPATQKGQDLSAAWNGFGMFELAGLVVTKLDETDGFGDLFNLAYREKAPLYYFSTGPRVLQDLKPASAEILVSYLLGS
jgi:flagellar biosynthesis protein FlhF